MKEIGIYIHIPFCKQKCIYCDFISYSDKTNLIDDYIKSIKNEIIEESKSNKKNLVTTIYFGGGTPSYIKKEYINEILQTIKENYNLNNEVEITIEINPGTVNKEQFKYYKDIGINRISIGLQSTQDRLLKLLGRIHTYHQFEEEYKNAREIGFKNINVDMIIGIPTQTLDEIKESINKIIKLNPEHISVYSLIVEENTALEYKIRSGELFLIDEDIERQMYWYTKTNLENNGYKHYEISNFSKWNRESKHNVNCWNQEEYLGFGVAAHSYKDNERYSNTSLIEEYISRKNIAEIRTINEIQTIKDKQKEYMLLGLRKIDGVNISEFKKKFIENPIYLFRNEINKLVKEDLIEVNLNYIKLTKRGIDLANLVWQEFI